MSAEAYGISDAARRCVEQVNLHVLAGAQGRWAAIRLSDGGSDGSPYDTKIQAAKHQLHPTQCCYILIPLFGMQEREAEFILRLNRDLYSKGIRLGIPDDPDIELMVPTRMESMPRGYHRR